jgi:hypothetical protein
MQFVTGFVVRPDKPAKQAQQVPMSVAIARYAGKSVATHLLPALTADAGLASRADRLSAG